MPPKRIAKKTYPLEPLILETPSNWISDRDTKTAERFAPKKFVVEKKTLNHRRYYDALRAFQIIAVNGPAGTLKTILACEAAAEALISGEVKRIVITRPMIPTGNSSRVGFLPGELGDKCSVYLSHMISMFKTLLPKDPISDFLNMEARLVFMPIDYMRGSTFDSQYVIADESQNCTSEEINMIINRMGMNSRLVINGDLDQVDIQNSGFEDALMRLDFEPSDDFTVVQMDEGDIVRNPLMREIARRWKKDYLLKRKDSEFTMSSNRFDADFGDEDIEIPSYSPKKR